MEIWIKTHYSHEYEISNLGRVKALPKYFRRKERILKPEVDKDGYLKTRLTKNKKKKCFFVHHLVLYAFVGDRPEGYVCNHKNGIKDDNRPENLEWVTISENQKHKFKVLGYKNNYHLNNPNKGKLGKNSNTPTKVIQYDLDMNFIRKWGSQSDAARELGLSASQISQCCLGKCKRVKQYIFTYDND